MARPNGKCFLAAILLCAGVGFFCFCRGFTARRDAICCRRPSRAWRRRIRIWTWSSLVPTRKGLRPELELQAKRLGIEARVHWTGMLEGDLKWGAFHAAEAFVLPSHQENFGIAVVEALACGVPVLISDKVNIWPDIVQDEAGLVNADTAEGTYRSMAALLAMQRKSGRIMSNGLGCFRARYEMKRTAQALNDLF